MAEKTTADESSPIRRRNFLLGAGTAVAAGLAPPAAAPAQPAASSASTAAATASEPPTYLTLTETEVAFFAAAADTMIPADELTPSGTDCGVVTFIDRQLASAWGGGAKMYRNGPFRKAKREYGYQLPLTPRQFFAAGIVATNAWTRKLYGKDFDRLATKDREERSTISTANNSSRRCYKSLWRPSSPTPSMAATATRPHGECSASLGCPRSIPT